MLDDERRLQLVKADKGSGNTVAVSANYLLENKSKIIKAKVPLYKIVKLDAQRYGVESIFFADLEALPPDQRDKKIYVLVKNWEDRIPKSSEIDPFTREVGRYASMAKEERVQEVLTIKATLEELKRNDAPPEVKAKAIVDAVQNMFSINKASLTLNKNEVGLHEKTIAHETQTIISSVVNMVEETKVTAHLLECFSALSNGQTINHITRVFTNMTGFMHYYNRIHQHRVAQELRLIFEKEFVDIYRFIMGDIRPHYFVPDNLVQLPLISPPEMKRYALGAFLHDIGKMANLDYFESSLAYDAKQIRQHVFVSVQLILINYQNDQEEAVLMAGDHHNLLFHKDGYGLTRLERERSIREPAELERCITGYIGDYHLGKAKGFLPTEMLAICDVYDAMTDNSRTYKQGMSPAEAVVFMYEKFLCAGKIDPVLFSIFVDYLLDQSLEVDPSYGLLYKAKARKDTKQ